jgi:hypothetical protein
MQGGEFPSSFGTAMTEGYFCNYKKSYNDIRLGQSEEPQ